MRRRRSSSPRPARAATPARTRVADPLGHGPRRRLRGAGEDQHELVAAVAREVVVLADLRAQRVRDAPQQRVAGGMAVLVVDALEVVEVDQHAAQRLAVAGRAGDLLADADLHRAVVEQPGEGVRARRGADVVVGGRVVAGDDGEVRDRLEHLQVLGADLAVVREPDGQDAAQLAALAQGDGGDRPEAGQRRQRGLVPGRWLDRGDRGRQDPAGDARARREAVAEPLGRHPVPGRGEAAPVLVDEVEAGHAAGDGGVGLPREGVEHLLQRVRHVERVGGPRERLVAPVLRGAPALGVEPGQPERGLVGERLGEHDGLGAPRPGPRTAPRRGGRRRRRRPGPAAGRRPRASGRSPRRRPRRGADGLEQHGGGGRQRALQLAQRARRGRPRARARPGPPRRGGAAAHVRHALGYRG